jgi:hypothetical protein
VIADERGNLALENGRVAAHHKAIVHLDLKVLVDDCGFFFEEFFNFFKGYFIFLNVAQIFCHPTNQKLKTSQNFI